MKCEKCGAMIRKVYLIPTGGARGKDEGSEIHIDLKPRISFFFIGGNQVVKGVGYVEHYKYCKGEEEK